MVGVGLKSCCTCVAGPSRIVGPPVASRTVLTSPQPVKAAMTNKPMTSRVEIVLDIATIITNLTQKSLQPLGGGYAKIVGNGYWSLQPASAPRGVHFLEGQTRTAQAAAGAAASGVQRRRRGNG